MPVPTRPTKASTGTQSYGNDTTIYANELNDESVALFGGFANLDDGNIAAAAGIDPSKIGDYSATDSEAKTAADPGSGGSLSLATDLEGEIARLRHAIERLASGASATDHAKRYDGTSNVDCAWQDLPARGPNLATNGSFEVKQSATATDACDSWALVGTPASVALAATDVSEGGGRMVTITTDAGSGTEGISQTFTRLRASTRYLITVRAKATTGTARLVTVGADATSQFRDITLDSASASFVTLRAIVQTDSTPNPLVVSLRGVASGDVVSFDHFAIQECSPLPAPVPSSFSTTSALTTAVALASGVPTDSTLSCVVVPPLPGYSIEARAKCVIYHNAASVVKMELKENGSVVDTSYHTTPANHMETMTAEYLNPSPTPGTTYTYTVTLTSSSGASTLCQLTDPYGAATTPRSSLIVRVS